MKLKIEIDVKVEEDQYHAEGLGSYSGHGLQSRISGTEVGEWNLDVDDQGTESEGKRTLIFSGLDFAGSLLKVLHPPWENEPMPTYSIRGIQIRSESHWDVKTEKIVRRQ